MIYLHRVTFTSVLVNVNKLYHIFIRVLICPVPFYYSLAVWHTIAVPIADMALNSQKPVQTGELALFYWLHSI